ncbi:MAG TPA: universal stress protein [Actinocrinis sp.]
MIEHGADGPGVIVVGVDGSECSWRAAAYAAGMARRQGSRLGIVYVQPTHAIAASVGLGAAVTETVSKVAQDIERQIREGAEQMSERAALHWDFYTFPGDVFIGLSNVADDLRADAVVVGTCRRLEHRFFGSPSLRLVKARRWPVIVVP